MEKIRIELEGRPLMEGRSEWGDKITLYETENQFILMVNDELRESLNHDSDFRGLVCDLDGMIAIVDWCDMDFDEYVEYWLEVGCDCHNLDEIVTAYYRSLGE